MEALSRSQPSEILALCRDETVFVRLCNALVLAVAARRYGESGFRPEFTERTKAKDEGVDALIEVTGEGDEPSGGLIGAGASAYQFKFSAERETSSLARSLRRDLGHQLSKIKARFPSLKRYVVLTNQDLGPSSGRRRRQAEEALKENFDAWGVTSSVFGAAELAAWLVDYPAVALSFGSRPAFELNEDRRWRLLRLSSLLGGPDSFVGREAETEQIRRFAVGSAGGVLVVSGPPGIGKSRLVTEVIAGDPPTRGRAYWLLRPDASDLRERFHALQLQRGSIAIIDELSTRDEAQRCLEVALEFPAVKTILIARTGLAPSVRASQFLQLAGLSFEAETRLIDLLALRDHRLKDWLRHQSGGNPGVVLEYAAAVRDLEKEGLTDKEAVRAIHERLYATFIPEIETAKVAAWLALAHFVDLDSLSDSDRRLADVIGVDYSDAARLNEHAKVLADRGLVGRAGSRIRFEAPFLLPGLIERRLFPIGDRLPEALARLSTDNWARLFTVLEPLRDRKDVHESASDILRSTLFSSVEKLFEKAELFVACGRIAPARAAEKAYEFFRVESALLPPLLKRQASWKVLDLLRDCLYERGAEEVAVAALIEASLADGDGQMPGRRVDERYLLGLWSRLHWTDIGLPLSKRGELLRELARHEDPRRRLLAARAGGAALSPFYFEMMSPRSSVVLPETSRSALTWPDVGAYYEAVMSELLRLSGDSNPLISEKAQSALHGFRFVLMPFVSVEVIKKVIHHLVEKAEITSNRAALRTELKDALEDIGKHKVREFDDWYSNVVTVLDHALNKLDPENGFDFETEVRDVFGRRLGGPDDTLWGWRVGAGAPPPSTPLQQRALRVIESVAQEPRTLTPPLHGFLRSTDAAFAWLFWRLVGQRDRLRRWADILIQNADRAAFADYMAGWSEVAPGDADAFLDRLLTRAEGHDDELVFGATWKQEPTERRALRVIDIVRRGHVPRRSAAAWLATGGWLSRLPESIALDVFRALAEDPDSASSAELLDAVYGLFIGPQVARDERVREFAWNALNAAAAQETSVSSARVRREFFSLGAKLVELGDDEKGFGLFERLLRKPPDLFEDRAESLMLSDLGAALAKANRPRLVRMVLEHVVEHRDSFPGGMPTAGMLLNPDTDREQILRAIGSDPVSARAVLSFFTGEEPHFLELVAAILERVPRDEDFWYELVYRYAYAHVIMGSSAEHAKRKIEGLRDFAVRHQPVATQVKAWLEYAQKALGRRRVVAEQWEFVRGFWDGKGTAEEAVALLDRPLNDPDRRWFVRRLLENEKKGLVRRILRDEEISQALEEDSELSPRAREEWEALLKRGATAWRS